MKQVIRVVRKDEIIKEMRYVLSLETDYLLATLHQAMEQNDEKEKEKCIRRLKEIQEELVRINC